jgi:DNA-binding NarL/FixJ family response regulator
LDARHVQSRKVLMIDDHALVRQGVRLLLEQSALGCQLLEAGSWGEARQVLAEHPDVAWVLLDLALPDAAGLDVLGRLRREHAGVTIVVLSGTEERALVLDCINRGAVGFIGKSASGKVLADALRRVFSGDVYLPPSIMTSGASSLSAESPNVPPPSAGRRARLQGLGLTPRQIEVFELVVQGLSNKAIAERLELSEPTVKTHVAAGLRALNVRNRTQAVFVLASWGHLGARGLPADD